MKNNNTLFIILSIIVVIVAFLIVKEVIPFINEKEVKNRVFNEIQLNWKDTYGELKKGTYRIVKNKNFTTLYSESFNIK